MQIADADEEGIQRALCQAYEDKTLRGRKLLTVRRIIELRKANGKRSTPGVRRRNDGIAIGRSHWCAFIVKKRIGKSSW